MFAQTTIKDVARAAGVHFTTVSMALRDHPAIAARTRTRIQNIAKLVGYQRNEVFFALSQQRKSQHKPQDIPTILYLFRGGSSRDFFEMSHHRQFLAGASEEAKKLGYQLDPHLVGPTGILPERLQRHLLRTQAAGVVIGAWDPTLEAPVVDWTRLPTVKIDSRHVLADVPVVSFDQMNGVITSYRKARSLGYRRIGLALGEKDEDATDGLHLSGWLIAQSEFPRLEKIPPLFFPPRATTTTILPLLGPWIRQHRVDAIMSNWRSVDQMLEALKDPAATKIGRVCLCCSPEEHELAGIRPNLDLVGQRAISLLGSIINASRDTLPSSLSTCYVEGTWHDGPSLQPKR